MLSRVNGGVWMDGEGAGSWSRSSDRQDELGLSTFKSLLEVEEEEEWYMNSNSNPCQSDFQSIQNHQEIKEIGFPSDPHQESALFQHMDSSSSCSTSPVFNLDPSQPFFLPKSCMSASSSLLGAFCSNPFDGGFDLGCDAFGFLAAPSTNSSVSVSSGNGILPGFGNLVSSAQMGTLDFSSETQFQTTRFLPPSENAGSDPSGFWGFSGSAVNALFQNRPKALRPLEIFPSIGAPPTLFQKRAALRQSSAGVGNGRNSEPFCSEPTNLIRLEDSSSTMEKRDWKEDEDKKMIKKNEEDKINDASFDASCLNYDSDESARAGNVIAEQERTMYGGNNSNADSTITGTDQKGKKKGFPAKNLMAERRRRQKLNDRLYMLRSVVPKISKMDRASILGDAIKYLKELLQRINDLHNELESTPCSSSMPAPASFHPLTPTPLTLPSRVKEEICPSSLPSPNGQPARVEVRMKEGTAVNIHMFCALRPGLLLSTMRALDGLGLDIQQAVISCFNGFALDIFRAEQCKEGPGVLPEDVKTVLLHSAGLHRTMLLDH